jgi:ribosome-associated translation inhibitor RaiA
VGQAGREEVVRLTDTSNPPIEVVKRGDVDESDVEYAMKRIGAAMGLIGAPVLFVRVRLSRDAEPKRPRPSIAQTTLDVNGELIRAQVAGDTMTEAIDLLADRLRDQIQHRSERLRARRTRRLAQPGEWRHGDVRHERSLFAELPVDERDIVRHKSFATHPSTPDEAADDMEQLDYDFWLFHDLASDADAVIERLEDDSCRLQRARPVEAEAGPVAIDLEVVEQPPPTTTVPEARAQLEDGGLRFLFFVDADTGRGSVIYRRYDGHYGQLSLA